MKISQMRYFSEACHSGSITRAAENLHISQPAVTAAIKALEEELGVPLMHRGKKRVIPTGDGDLFLKRCDSILSDIDGLVDDFHLRSATHRAVTVGIPPMIGYFLFPQIFGEFRQKYPRTNIKLLEAGSETAKTMVKDGDLELAIITMGNVPPPALHAQIIIRTQLMYCVGNGHRLSGKSSITFQEIGNDPLILFSNAFYHSKLLEARFAKEEMEPNILFNSNQLMTIKGFVRNNIASAFLLPQIIEPGDNLIPLPVVPPLSLNVAVIWQKEAFVTKEAKQLIRFIHSRFE